MAGHSHANNVKARKDAVNKKKTKIFTKIARIISIAVKEGKSVNPDTNPRLRLALKMAQTSNVPKDIIQKALNPKKEESNEVILYEGYIKDVAILVLTETPNKNKTAPEIRFIFSKHGGEIKAPSSALSKFEKVAKIECQLNQDQEEEFFEQMIEFGAIDIKNNIAYFPADELHSIQELIEAKNFNIELAEIFYKPIIYANHAKLESVNNIMEAVEDHENTIACWNNYDYEKQETN